MSRVLIWDVPTRLFHWLLAAGVIAAAALAFLAGEHSRLFPYHSLIGLTICAMVVLRMLWGLVGTRYARFNSFLFGPASVLAYVGGVLSGSGRRYIGHNPGSAWAIFAMLALVLALGVTGFLLGRGDESIKEVHEFLAYALLAVAGLHVLGVLAHTLRHKENLTLAMITGRKAADASDAIRSTHPLLGLAFVIATATWAAALVSNFDPSSGRLRLPGVGAVLEIGENDRGDGEGPGREHEEHDD